MKSTKTKKAIICTVSELATDYRLHKLSKTLKEAGFDSTFICRKKNGHLPFKKGDTPVIYMNTIWEKGPLFYLFFNLRIFIHLLFHNADLIVSVDLDTLTGCCIAKRIKRFRLFFDSHEYFPESPEIQNKIWIKNIWLTAEKWFVPHIDIGTTVCQPIADIYKTKYHKNFIVVRNAPLANRLQNKTLHQKPRKNNFTIIYQGAVNYGRALKQLIEAMKYIPDAHLLIVGDGDLFNELKPMVDKQKNKITLTGKVPFEQLPGYTQQADLGVALLENVGLNNYYALPNRLFDAIQAELPMLGINFPEIEKFITENDFGKIIHDIEPKTIANAILEIKNNPQQIEQWRKNASLAQQKISWENETDKLKKALNFYW